MEQEELDEQYSLLDDMIAAAELIPAPFSCPPATMAEEPADQLPPIITIVDHPSASTHHHDPNDCATYP